MITYENIIEIIRKTFETNQIEIANEIGYEKSTISKFKKGTVSPKKRKDLKKLLLDKTFKKNINQGLKTPEEQLEILKDTIEKSYETVKEDMNDYWNETDYEKFVTILLDKAVAPQMGKTPPPQNEKAADNGLIFNPIRMPKSNPVETATSTGNPSNSNGVSDDNFIYQSSIAIDEKYMICQYCSEFRDLKDNNNPNIGICSFSGNSVYKNSKSCKSFDPKYGAITTAIMSEKSPKL